ncbi:Rad2-like endonuclease [Aspergillus sclerotiicarbonarius CBS 121057]|uniref:Rad2-like endonuclease n=1 Tax=Aspergillus sclerotiicarbonarius (strain CBS 121057 / IBT 28362) TaxID=1448318 RepID=A0A319DWW1_ASPSB|nr:Rad2-like endonuclease [Aspergillus sclerotiicarbonarius CBS 121057]
MGIPGLIHAIGAGERISLSRLAVTHLERTARPIRIAVDISIWLFQVQAGRGGRNPELRTLFYRLLKILALPIHPLFVYDGKNKPPFKRGKAVSGRSYGSAPIIRLSKILVDLFRFPRHEAPGEAEAECARLQRAGVVDAVMSNDVDALMFGSTFTVMGFSKESGSGTTAATHVTCYRMDSTGEPSNVMLDRAGMILFAMLSGGDYLPSGVPKCGSKLAGEIAKAGFGADLLEILDSDCDDLDAKLGEWRERLQYELEENESGYFQTKHKAVRIPDTFPDRTIMSYYAKPVVSTTSDLGALQHGLVNAWDKDIDVVELRRFAANTFEWNYRSGARKVTKLLSEPLVSYRLRLGRQASAFPENIPRLSNGTVPMLQKIYRSRSSYSTDGLTEFQLDIVPVDVVGFDILADEPNPPLPSQESTVSGDEEEELENEAVPVPQSPAKKRVTKRYDPYTSEKVWVFEALATIGIPEVVENWKREQAEKAAPKKPTARKTGPRKKGPIDPAMKRGSILKYGTLTKERTEISSYKGAALLEAAVAAKSPSKPSLSSSRQSPDSPNYSRKSPRSNIYSQQQPLTDENEDYPSFDDLVDRFSTLCHVSPKADAKGQPRLDRARATGGRRSAFSDDSDLEIVEVPTAKASPACPSFPPGPEKVRSKQERNVTSGKKDAPPSLSSTRASCQDGTRPRRHRYQRRSSPEVEGLGQAISLIALDDTKPHKPSKETTDLEDPQPIPQKISRQKKTSYIKSGPTRSDIQMTHPLPTMEEGGCALNPKGRNDAAYTKKFESRENPMGLPDRLSETKKVKPKKDMGSKVSGNSATPASHVESVIVQDGYWTTEAPAETRCGSDKSIESNSTVNTSKSRSKKKRIPRVSILDLT